MTATPRVPTLHLISGAVGSGKTTLAEFIESRRRAVRFSSDEWTLAVFGQRAPSAAEVEVCRSLMRLQGQRVLAIGVDVIFDFGLWTRVARDRYVAFGKSLGAHVRLYHCRCVPSEAVARLNARNKAGAGSTYRIEPADVLRLHLEYEAPDPSEGVQIIEAATEWCDVPE